MNRESTIAKKLRVLKPQYLKITNDSHLHNGHLFSPNNDQSHYTIELASEFIANKKLLEQHKIINTLLKEEFDDGLHALSIKIVTK